MTTPILVNEGDGLYRVLYRGGVIGYVRRAPHRGRSRGMGTHWQRRDAGPPSDWYGSYDTRTFVVAQMISDWRKAHR